MDPAKKTAPTGPVAGNGALALEDPDILEPDAGEELTPPRRRRAELDPAAQVALTVVKEKGKLVGSAEKAVKRVQQKGLSDDLARVTERLNRMPLDEVSRTLLSDPDVFGKLLLVALDQDKVKTSPPVDTTGIVESIRQNVEEPGFRGTFEGALVREVFRANQIVLSPKDASEGERALAKALSQRILKRVRSSNLTLGPGEPGTLVLGVHREVAAAGHLPTLIRQWGEDVAKLPSERLADPVVLRMVAHLQGLGIDFRAQDLALYDRYFAVAYDQATRSQSSSSDPIVLSRSQPIEVTPWDFKVDIFEAAEEQGVLRDNILAAGALDYVWNLGEVLGVFKLADALVLRWAAGMLDIAEAGLSSKLYRYWQLREDRLSSEERGMLYKRVLDKGDAELLPRMVVNASFDPLWHTLMEKVTEYIELSSDAARETAVSRVPIVRATRDLQFNLTEHMTGMGHMQVTDMYMQLREAFELLGASEITAQLNAGRRRSVWATIERLHREEFGQAPDVAGIRTLAVEGNKVFQWIADLDAGVADADFETFRDAAEAWIIAVASTGDGMGPASGPADQEEDPDFDLDPEDSEEDAW